MQSVHRAMDGLDGLLTTLPAEEVYHTRRLNRSVLESITGMRSTSLRVLRLQLTAYGMRHRLARNLNPAAGAHGTMSFGWFKWHSLEKLRCLEQLELSRMCSGDPRAFEDPKKLEKP